MAEFQSSSKRSYDRAKRVLYAAFPPTVKVVEPNAKEDFDLKVGGHPIDFKWIGQGHLGDVRKFLKNPAKKNLVLVARQMSPGARNALAESGTNWADETGAAEIAIGTIYISKTGNPKKKDQAIKHWSPSVIAIAEALLCGIRGTQSATQAVTGLSSGGCANALKFLSEQKLLASKAARGPASAREIVDQRRLLDAYANAANTRFDDQEIQVGVTWQDILSGIGQLGARIDEKKIDWAVTGAAAAAIEAPHLSTLSHATIYVDAKSIAELEALVLALELRPIQGGRLTMKPFPAVSVQRLSQSHGEFRIAPWPRVFADLLKEGVRGEEAAEQYYEIVHG